MTSLRACTRQQSRFSDVWRNKARVLEYCQVLDLEEFQKDPASSQMPSAVLILGTTQSRLQDILTAYFCLPKRDARTGWRGRHLSSAAAPRN